MASAVLIGVVVVYLLAMLGIGYYYRDRASNESGFLVADRTIGSFIGGGALAVTFISTSSLLGAASLSYRVGIMWAIYGGLGGVFSYFVSMYFLGPQLRDVEAETLPEYFGNRFGQYSKNLSAIIIAVVMTIYLIAQIQGGAHVAVFVLGIDFTMAVLIVGAIFILYTALGGMYAVTVTSFIQASVLILAVILVSAASLVRFGGIGPYLAEVQSQAPYYFTNTGRIGLEFALGFGLLVFLAGLCSPHVIFRYFASKDRDVAEQTAGVAAIYQGLFFFFLVLAPAAAILLVPNLENPDQAFLALTQTVLGFSPLLTGLVFAGILAAAMSTADAMLMNASSAVVHDLLTDYVDIDGDRLMLYTRGVTVLIGILVVGLTISPPALILTLAILALALFIGGFLTPVMIGLYTDERSDVAGAIAMGIGVVSVVLTHPDTPAIQLATQAYAGIAGAGLALVAYVLVNRIVSPQAPSGTPVGDD